jgi:hypothetical protein
MLMSFFPHNIVQDNYIRLYTTSKILWIKLITGAIIILAILWFKTSLFRLIYRLTGLDFMLQLSQGSLLLIVLSVLYVISAIYLILWLKTHYYEVFPDRVIVSKGIISKKTVAVKMTQFGQVVMDIGIIGRLLSYGTIQFQYVALGPLGDMGISMYNIHDPARYMQRLAGILDMAQKSETGKVGNGYDNNDEITRVSNTAAVAAAASNTNKDQSVSPSTTPDQDLPTDTNHQEIRGEIKL